MEENSAKTISNKILYIVSLNHFVNDSSVYLVSSLFPAMIVAFGFSEYQIGVLVAIGYLISLIFQPLTGKYSERFESRWLLALGISLMAGAMLLFTVSSTFSLMIVSVLILRFGSSFFHPVGVSAVSRTYHGAKLDSSMGFQSAFGNLGIVLAFIMSAPVYLAIGWRGPFLIYCALGLTTVGITLGSTRKESEPPIASEVESGETRKRTKLSLGLPLFFVLSSFITGGCYAIFGNFGNVLLYKNGFGLSFSNYLLAIWVVSAFAGAMLTGRLTRRVTRPRLLLTAFLVAGLAALLFGLAGQSIYLALSALVANGFAVSMTYPATYSELSAYLKRTKGRASAFGILFSCQIAGSSILGFLAGYLGATFGLAVVFEIVAALLISATAVVFLWFRRSWVKE